MTDYTNDVPGDWFSDPILRGVPGTGNEVVGDDNPLAWQADALCSHRSRGVFSREGWLDSRRQADLRSVHRS